jgi:hypothetical protein
MLESVQLRCPFCGEQFEALADPSGGEAEYIEDCPVCCQPITLHLHLNDEGEFDSLKADRE